ncbi:MAG: diacylglycerol kinase family protein [Spirochaetes bacterium]|nr:diacylglycerol kinase family protein [Spirochaetota bacterium]
MYKIGIIVNPHARSIQKSRNDIAVRLAQIGKEFVDVRLSNSLEELDAILADFKNKDISCIATCGGDGTIHHVVCHMINMYAPSAPPPLLILKGGTMDNIARTIDLKGKSFDILRRMIAVLESGKIPTAHRRDTMKIGNRYCFLFGLGLTTNFLDAVYEGEKGTLKNLKVIGRAIFEGLTDKKSSSLFKRVYAHITVDGKELPFREILAILAGTVEQIGMGFSPLPRANEKDGTFHAIITGEKPIEGVKQFFRIKKGLPMKGKYNFNDIISRLTIVADSPFRYTMDGELYDCDRSLVVEMGIPIYLIKV